VPTAREVMDPIRSGLLPVPATPQQGVCRICHSSCDSNYSQCFPCFAGIRAGTELNLLPISMSVHSGLLHEHLRGYKDNQSDEVRERMTYRLAALVSVFLTAHATCVGEFDTVSPIGSPERCAPGEIIRRVTALKDLSPPTLIARSHDKQSISPDRFQVVRNVKDERILLFDDTFTSGASMFSATLALRMAGATVVGPVVVGRHFQPNYTYSKELNSWLGQREWSPDRCARCGGERRDPQQMF
jgi:predicted amidophosphoribosyltransferase